MKHLPSVRALVTSIVTATILVACSASDATAPTSPASSVQAPQPESSNSLLGDLLGITKQKTIKPVTRAVPLKANVTVSKRIGPLGGTILVPEAGLSIVVPPLALSSAQNISVTALAGSNLAYEFAPHGLKFVVPLVMTQDLRAADIPKTSLLGSLNLSLGYFPDPKQITSVTELLDVNVNLLHLTAVSTIWHFSGYIYACGRGDEGGGDF